MVIFSGKPSNSNMSSNSCHTEVSEGSSNKVRATNEHGKGFAVVANEVGKLAEQSRNAVLDVASLTNTIQPSLSV